MMTRKYISILVAVIFFSAFGAGGLKESLSQPDPVTGARSIVTEHGFASGNYSDFDPNKTIQGHRVRIFYDNKQDSRSRSLAIVEQFKSQFPDIPVYWSYDIPYFKVTVGDCLTSEEATIIWGRVKNIYQTAFMVREDIPLKNFLISPADSSVETADSLEIMLIENPSGI